MKILRRIVGQRVDAGRFDFIHANQHWYGFTVNYRRLFFIVFGVILFYVINNFFMDDPIQPDDPPTQTFKQSIYRVSAFNNQGSF